MLLSTNSTLIQDIYIYADYRHMTNIDFKIAPEVSFKLLLKKRCRRQVVRT